MEGRDVTASLKALAEPRRWRIAELLAEEELCVCHLSEDMGVPQPLVSHHLKVLRDAGLVESEKHRQWTYYRLRPGTLKALGHRITSLGAASPSPRERRRPCG
jgi:ArsR family transcriptional regulator, arsenate/arsenite/antimonite-responsive transcriptional repressor